MSLEEKSWWILKIWMSVDDKGWIFDGSDWVLNSNSRGEWFLIRKYNYEYGSRKGAVQNQFPMNLLPPPVLAINVSMNQLERKKKLYCEFKKMIEIVFFHLSLRRVYQEYGGSGIG